MISWRGGAYSSCTRTGGFPGLGRRKWLLHASTTTNNTASFCCFSWSSWRFLSLCSYRLSHAGKRKVEEEQYSGSHGWWRTAERSTKQFYSGSSNNSSFTATSTHDSLSVSSSRFSSSASLPQFVRQAEHPPRTSSVSLTTSMVKELLTSSSLQTAKKRNHKKGGRESGSAEHKERDIKEKTPRKENKKSSQEKKKKHHKAPPVGEGFRPRYAASFPFTFSSIKREASTTSTTARMSNAFLGNDAASASFFFIVSQRMTPIGCSCTLVLPPPSVTASFSASFTSCASSSPLISSHPISLILPGVLPRHVYVIPRTYLTFVQTFQRLPRPSQVRMYPLPSAFRGTSFSFVSLLQWLLPSRSRLSPSTRCRSRSRPRSLPWIPCPYRRLGMCHHCPWMIAGGRMEGAPGLPDAAMTSTSAASSITRETTDLMGHTSEWYKDEALRVTFEEMWRREQQKRAAALWQQLWRKEIRKESEASKEEVRPPSHSSASRATSRSEKEESHEETGLSLVSRKRLEERVRVAMESPLKGWEKEFTFTFLDPFTVPTSLYAAQEVNFRYTSDSATVEDVFASSVMVPSKEKQWDTGTIVSSHVSEHHQQRQHQEQLSLPPRAPVFTFFTTAQHHWWDRMRRDCITPPKETSRHSAVSSSTELREDPHLLQQPQEKQTASTPIHATTSSGLSTSSSSIASEENPQESHKELDLLFQKELLATEEEVERRYQGNALFFSPLQHHRRRCRRLEQERKPPNGSVDPHAGSSPCSSAASASLSTNAEEEERSHSIPAYGNASSSSHRTSSTHANSPSLQVHHEKEGSGVGSPCATPTMGKGPSSALRGPVHCLWLTLAQQRLQAALSHWAGTLPRSLQQCIRGATIWQASDSEVDPTTKMTTAAASPVLQVVLLVEQSDSSILRRLREEEAADTTSTPPSWKMKKANTEQDVHTGVASVSPCDERKREGMENGPSSLSSSSLSLSSSQNSMTETELDRVVSPLCGSMGWRPLPGKVLAIPEQSLLTTVLGAAGALLLQVEILVAVLTRETGNGVNPSHEREKVEIHAWEPHRRIRVASTSFSSLPAAVPTAGDLVGPPPGVPSLSADHASSRVGYTSPATPLVWRCHRLQRLYPVVHRHLETRVPPVFYPVTAAVVPAFGTVSELGSHDGVHEQCCTTTKEEQDEEAALDEEEEEEEEERPLAIPRVHHQPPPPSSSSTTSTIRGNTNPFLSIRRLSCGTAIPYLPASSGITAPLHATGEAALPFLSFSICMPALPTSLYRLGTQNGKAVGAWTCSSAFSRVPFWRHPKSLESVLSLTATLLLDGLEVIEKEEEEKHPPRGDSRTPKKPKEEEVNDNNRRRESSMTTSCRMWAVVERSLVWREASEEEAEHIAGFTTTPRESGKRKEGELFKTNLFHAPSSPVVYFSVHEPLSTAATATARGEERKRKWDHENMPHEEDDNKGIPPDDSWEGTAVLSEGVRRMIMTLQQRIRIRHPSAAHDTKITEEEESNTTASSCTLGSRMAPPNVWTWVVVVPCVPGAAATSTEVLNVSQAITAAMTSCSQAAVDDEELAAGMAFSSLCTTTEAAAVPHSTTTRVPSLKILREKEENRGPIPRRYRVVLLQCSSHLSFHPLAATAMALTRSSSWSSSFVARAPAGREHITDMPNMEEGVRRSPHGGAPPNGARGWVQRKAGIIDVDPMTSGAVGYAVLEFEESG